MTHHPGTVSKARVEAAAKAICCPNGCHPFEGQQCRSYQVAQVARGALTAALSVTPAGKVAEHEMLDTRIISSPAPAAEDTSGLTFKQLQGANDRLGARVSEIEEEIEGLRTASAPVVEGWKPIEIETKVLQILVMKANTNWSDGIEAAYGEAAADITRYILSLAAAPLMQAGFVIVPIPFFDEAKDR